MNDLIRFFQICVESSTWPDYVKNEKNKIQSGYYDSENNDLKNEFEKYLDQFDWEKDKDKILKIQGEPIRAYSYNEVPEYVSSEDFFRSYCNIECENRMQKLFYNSILKEHVYRQDIELVQKLLLKIQNTLDLKNILYDFQVKVLISDINKATSEFISPKLKERFDVHLLNFFSKKQIKDFGTDVWDIFKQHWKENIRELLIERIPDLSIQFVPKPGDEIHKTKIDTPKNTEYGKLLNEDEIKLIIDTLEKLKITKNGKYFLGKRKKSSIRAVLDVLVENGKITNLGIKYLCSEIGTRINTNLNSLPERDSKTYDFYFKNAKKMLINF